MDQDREPATEQERKQGWEQEVAGEGAGEEAGEGAGGCGRWSRMRGRRLRECEQESEQQRQAHQRLKQPGGRPLISKTSVQPKADEKRQHPRFPSFMMEEHSVYTPSSGSLHDMVKEYEKEITFNV